MGVFGSNDRPKKWITRLIQKKARSLVGKYGFTVEDQPDIQQELYLHLLQRQHRYDSRRGKETTYYSWLIDNYIRKVIENRCADKRNSGLPDESLDGRD